MRQMLHKLLPNLRDLSRPPLILAVAITLALFTALCLLAPRMRAVRHDTSANFWYAITGIDIGTKNPQVPFPCDDVIYDRGRFIYGCQYPFQVYFDLPYESLSESDAQADLPRIRQELEKRAAQSDPDDYV